MKSILLVLLFLVACGGDHLGIDENKAVEYSDEIRSADKQEYSKINTTRYGLFVHAKHRENKEVPFRIEILCDSARGVGLNSDRLVELESLRDWAAGVEVVIMGNYRVSGDDLENAAAVAANALSKRDLNSSACFYFLSQEAFDPLPWSVPTYDPNK